MALSLASINVQNNNAGFLSQMVRSLSQLRTVCLQCRSNIQITQELRRILDDQYDVNFTKSETSHASQISNLSLRSLLIGMGSCHTVINTLGRSISQGLTSNDSSDFFLPSGNHPSWLAYTGDGPLAQFQVPENIDCDMKGIILCVVYSSSSENIGAESLTSVLIINYTKYTIQIYKHDTVISFNDEDWKNVTSSLEPGDDVEIFVVFGGGVIVKETAVYLIYGQSITTDFEQSIIMEVEPSTNMEMEPSAEVNVQLSPKMEVQPSLNLKVEASITMEIEHSIAMEVESSTNMEMEPLEEVKFQPSPKVDMQPSPNVKVEASTVVKIDPSPQVKMQSSLIMEMKPPPKLNKSIFTRLGKRMGACLCLNQHRDKGLNNF
ncbi:unnamed protein product [Trifolium pratense]|uniref:Uncharacterized protein n=1 Tax=Trifolium pratense TaxID=57577 RepID=A0ACB0ISV2_TRIPR|nr:unnamed protein product [Trifolium pratense]